MNYEIFTEFDACEAAIRHAQVQMTLHRQEREQWAVGETSIGPLHLQWGRSGDNMVPEGEIRPGGRVLFVPLTKWSTNGVNGRRLKEGSITVAESGAEFCISAGGWNDWFLLFIPQDCTF